MGVQSHSLKLKILFDGKLISQQTTYFRHFLNPRNAYLNINICSMESIRFWLWCRKDTCTIFSSKRLSRDHVSKWMYVKDVASPDGNGCVAYEVQYTITIVYGCFILTLSYRKLSYTTVVKYCTSQVKLQFPSGETTPLAYTVLALWWAGKIMCTLQY